MGPSGQRRGAPAAWLAGSVALAVLVPGRASAQAGPEPVRFGWVRADDAGGCADQQRIAAQVTARLGKSPFANDAPRSIEAIVHRTPHGFHVALYVRGPGGVLAGSRELTSESQDCASIEAASVLAIALAIDPDAGARPPPAPPAPVPVPVPAPPVAAAPPWIVAPPLPAPAPPPAAQHEAPAPPAPGLGDSGMALRAGVGLGLLPGVAPGVLWAGHAGLGRWVQLTGEALWMPEARTGDGHFAFGLSAVALGVCVPAVRSAWADLAACGSVWGGALHAVVFDLTPVRPGDYGWVAAEASPRLRLRLVKHLHAELGAHLIVPLDRRPFVVTGWKDPAFQQAPVTLLPFVGLGANFP